MGDTVRRDGIKKNNCITALVLICAGSHSNEELLPSALAGEGKQRKIIAGLHCLVANCTLTPTTLLCCCCSYLCWTRSLWSLLQPLVCHGNNAQGWSYSSSVMHSSRSQSARCSSSSLLPSISVPSLSLMLNSPEHVKVSVLERKKGPWAAAGRKSSAPAAALANC